MAHGCRVLALGAGVDCALMAVSQLQLAACDAASTLAVHAASLAVPACSTMAICAMHHTTSCQGGVIKLESSSPD